jgi:hypothetical protein
MKTSRAWMAVVLVLTAAAAAPAQSVFLGETGLRDACFHNDLVMALRGTVTVPHDGKSTNFPRTAQATHKYFERYIDLKDGAVERSARFYNHAEATITDNQEKFKLALKANHAFLVAHRVKDQLIVYHLKDALSREEMEITSHFDSLAVPSLLPAREVRVGDEWKVSREALQAICDLDGVEKADVTGRVVKFEGDFVYLSFQGLVNGVDMAAPVKIMVKDATAAFNMKLKRLTQVDWKLSDQRDQGPVSPALSADIHFQLKRVPVDQPEPLNDIALVRVPNGPPPAKLTNLVYRNLEKSYEFQFGRDWYVVSQAPDGKMVLRLVDARGDFVAQCAVTPWQKIDSKNAMKLEEFTKLMQASKGWVQKDGPPLDATDKITSPNGYTILRVTAEGKLSGVDAIRSFYLVATPAGEQVLVDFTMLPVQASKLGARDADLVQSFQFFAVENGRVEAVPASKTK